MPDEFVTPFINKDYPNLPLPNLYLRCWKR